MKICRECKRTLPPEDFYVHAKMADGRLNKCKGCVKARVGRHRQANLDHVQAYDRSRSDLPHRVAARAKIAANLPSEKRLEYNRRHDARYPDKRSAHTTLSNAIRDGNIVRADRCACGFVGPLEGHHDDYARPLDIRWLCAPCHVAHHKAERARRRQKRLAA